MKIFPIRRTALAAAAVAALSFPAAAAAQTDAAQTDAAWRQVMELIRLKGERRDGEVDHQRVTGWIGDLNDVHTTYTAMVFLTDVAGEPVAHSAALGITKFTPIAGTDRFQTVGWQLMLTATGRLTEAHYSEATGNRRIGFTQVKSTKLDAADPVVKARFVEVLTYWTSR